MSSKNTFFGTLIGALTLIVLWIVLVWYWPRPADQSQAEGEQDGTRAAATATQPSQTMPTSPPLPSPTPTSPQVLIITEPHQVQAGETIQSIAQQHNTSMILMAMYLRVDDLSLGNTIAIPVANPAVCPSRRIHVMQQTETLLSLAQRYATTVDAIREANGLTGDPSGANPVLCIP